MSRTIGTVVRGIRCPIIREGDDLVKITVDSLTAACEEGSIVLRDKDVVAMTESIVARSQGNYASVDDIAADIAGKFGPKAVVGVVFPILSRNRFAICLRGIAMAASKVYIQLSTPTDEVGNVICHPFTGVNYADYYRELVKGCGADVEIFESNDPTEITKYTQNVIIASIHSREADREKVSSVAGAKVHTLADILNTPTDKHGYNEDYGLLGSNKATEDKVKLFPKKECVAICYNIQKALQEKYGVHVEVMVYGDGAFKDPVGKIWELADPVVCPACTDGLEGTPNELKLKYLADNDFKNLSGDALREAIGERIKNKMGSLVGDMASQGTTPRRITDLLGSLCDLTSGSGDKGTPVILVQGYFDNYTTE